MADGGFLSARRWQLDVASTFLEWRADHTALARIETFAQAVYRVTTLDSYWRSSRADVAAILPDAHTRCGSLDFDDDAHVRAYAALHLINRYGRVLQVLEHAIEIGRLPLRRAGVAALEVGAGPAPALYATRDFYLDLVAWPGRGDISIGAMRAFDALDQGSGWDRYLHLLSEELLVTRREDEVLGNIGADDVRQLDAQLGFQRAYYGFEGFNIRRIHTMDLHARARNIQSEFDQYDEPIPLRTAFKYAYADGVSTPSACDFAFVSNFLTQPTMVDSVRSELQVLARSLTPGGLLVVLTGLGKKYEIIQSAVTSLANNAGLTSISPTEPFRANIEPAYRHVVAQYTRQAINTLVEACPQAVRADILHRLPGYLRSEGGGFPQHQFSALIFVNQNPPQR